MKSYKITFATQAQPRLLRRRTVAPLPHRDRSNRTFTCHSSNSAYGSWDYDTQEEEGESFDFQAIDGELLDTAANLLRHVHASLCSTHNPEETISPHEIAATALGTVEANGAVPPLSATQRTKFQAALERLVTKIKLTNCNVPDAELFEGDPAHWFDVTQEGLEPIRPEMTQLLEELVNANMQWKGHIDLASNSSAGRGGDVGNISLQSPKGVVGVEMVAPAQSETERTQLAAESQFMELEVDMFEPHSGPMHASGGGSISGDAPAAGDGLQIVEGGENPAKANKEEPEKNQSDQGHERPPASDF